MLDTANYPNITGIGNGCLVDKMEPACSRSPGCLCSMCAISAESLLLLTQRPHPPAVGKENRPPQRRQAPVVPAKVGAMELQAAPGAALLKPQAPLRQVDNAAVGSDKKALECSRSPGCKCPLCDSSAESLLHAAPPAAVSNHTTVKATHVAVLPVQKLASKPVDKACMRAPGCACPLCDTSVQAMLRSPPPPAPKLSARTSSKDAPTRIHASGAMPRPRHPSGKPTITPIKVRPQPSRGPGSQAAMAVLARVKAQAALACDERCPPALAAARSGDHAVLLAALTATSTSMAWATLDDVLAKMRKSSPNGVASRITQRSLARFLESTPGDVLESAGIWVKSFGPKYQPIVITNSEFASASIAGRNTCCCSTGADGVTQHQPGCPVWSPPHTSKLHSKRRSYTEQEDA